ncbi:hypothetical protein BDBG_03373 [Blastomyces gilchristii SLH14081]|uniref:Uncharacterized protein n=1 Tax=Blastomyces gilchristii (strain SLH14081) TaxID=559298 RepID=A0A179UGX3_BLAGS|nr:uncharacterized protein BDBG_03373 [Blastomyces gilchristii SLH14081]OAT07296.1 hypothetical protein BDBG_03373 [Blastomyces gilchristii SLH14081]
MFRGWNMSACLRIYLLTRSRLHSCACNDARRNNAFAPGGYEEDLILGRLETRLRYRTEQFAKLDSHYSPLYTTLPKTKRGHKGRYGRNSLNSKTIPPPTETQNLHREQQSNNTL